MAVVNPPARWSTDQTLNPSDQVDPFRGWPDYTEMWLESQTPTGSISMAALISLDNATDGSWNGVAVVGGAGTGATADVQILNGEIALLLFTSGGTGYQWADQVTFNPADVGGARIYLLVEAI